MADNRDLVLTLGAGSDQLKPIRIDAHEGLSQPFRVTVDVIAQGPIDLLKNIGKPAAINCRIDEESTRRFHGLVIDSNYVDEIKGTRESRIRGDNVTAYRQRVQRVRDDTG